MRCRVCAGGGHVDRRQGGERETGEQLGNPLIHDAAVVATSLVAKRAGEPAFADAGRAGDH